MVGRAGRFGLNFNKDIDSKLSDLSAAKLGESRSDVRTTKRKSECTDTRTRKCTLTHTYTQQSGCTEEEWEACSNTTLEKQLGSS